MKRIDRRSFLKVSALGTGGVMLSLYLPEASAQQGRGGPPQPLPDPHTYIKVAPDGTPSDPPWPALPYPPASAQGIGSACIVEVTAFPLTAKHKSAFPAAVLPVSWPKFSEVEIT